MAHSMRWVGLEEPMCQSHTPLNTLAELATEHPAASRVFQRYGLDFCCKGLRSLEAACAERGLDAPAILAEIESSTSAPQTSAGESSEVLVAHLVDHYHRRLREELPQLIAMAGKVERVHFKRSACPFGLAEHLTRMHEELLLHMVKEEKVLFPLILSGRTGLHGPVQVMEAEHRDHATNLERLRDLAHDFVPPPEACATWQALYLRLNDFERELMEHVHLENHVLFPRALGGE
jgi:regulator of cell morphogenesis and NO signaling